MDFIEQITELLPTPRILDLKTILRSATDTLM